MEKTRIDSHLLSGFSSRPVLSSGALAALLTSAVPVDPMQTLGHPGRMIELCKKLSVGKLE